jgi:hypothetical protein
VIIRRVADGIIIPVKLARVAIAAVLMIASHAGNAEESMHTEPLEVSLAKDKNLPEEFKEKVRKNVATIQRGEPLVEAGSVPGLATRLEAVRSRLKPVEEVVASGLTRPPSDVSTTSLQKGTLLGAWATGSLLDKVWTGIGRVFQDPELGLVILTEDDLNAGNSAMRTMPSEAINVRIRNQPGVLSVLSDPASGKSMTKLVWVDKAHVSLEMLTERTDPAAKQALLRIAESIRP